MQGPEDEMIGKTDRATGPEKQKEGEVLWQAPTRFMLPYSAKENWELGRDLGT